MAEKFLQAKVEIEDPTVIERKFNDYTFRTQAGYLRVNSRVTHEISVPVPDAGPYPAGVYVIAADTFRTDEYGRLQVSRKGVVLVPERPAGKVA